MSEKIATPPALLLKPNVDTPAESPRGAAARHFPAAATTSKKLEAASLSSEAAKTAGVAHKTKAPEPVGGNIDAIADKRLRETLDALTAVYRAALHLPPDATAQSVNQSMTPDKGLDVAINKLRAHPRQDILQALLALQAPRLEVPGSALAAVKAAMVADPLDYGFGALKDIAKMSDRLAHRAYGGAGAVHETPGEAASPPQQLAQGLIEGGQLELADHHVKPGHNHDHATARENFVDAAAGRPVRRSNYRDGVLKAPGGTTHLQEAMLRGLEQLTEKYHLKLSEVAGAAHAKNSRHYAGLAVDIIEIDGTHVKNLDPDAIKRFKADARAAGATEILAPGDKNHGGHIHLAWPRSLSRH